MASRSNWWYLAPIIFGLVGGILGYFGIRKDDPKKAKNILILGIVIFIVFSLGHIIFIGTIITNLENIIVPASMLFQ